MSHTELNRVTYYSGHVIEVNGKKYVPHRTCTMRFYMASNLWRCSECVGATHAERTNDEPPRFCQWCGAEVTKVIR